MELEEKNNNTIKDVESNLFRNVFLTAVARKLDLGSIVPFVDSMMHDASSEEIFDSKYSGLAFVELLSEEMKVPIGELLCSDIEFQRELVSTILSTISMEGILLDIDKGETKDDESYITYAISDLNVYEKTAEFKFLDGDSNSKDEEAERNDYIVELTRLGTVSKMSILTNNITNSDFFKGHVDVWSEEEGLLTDFIEDAFEENISFAFKEGVTEDELVACVFEDTRTINLMDRFEGIGEKYTKSYQRMVIKNGLMFCSYGDPYINLVIERRTNNNITGDITFTEFKQGDVADLRQHIIEELDHNILECFCDKDQFYRFKTGYLLRAQNSKNRSGYGWVWNWKNGVGTYVKGTEYGETTDYVFVGAYVSSTFLFDSSNRKSMIEWSEEVKDPVTDDNIQAKPVETATLIDNKQELAEEGENQNNPTPAETQKEEGEEEGIIIPRIYNVQELKDSDTGEQVLVGSKVRYKKLHIQEEAEVIIDEKKILHRRMLGKKQGEIVTVGMKRYLIISVKNN